VHPRCKLACQAISARTHVAGQPIFSIFAADVNKIGAGMVSAAAQQRPLASLSRSKAASGEGGQQ
jgi:hypothetical protein